MKENEEIRIREEIQYSRGVKEGRELGIEEGRIKCLADLARKGIITLSAAAEAGIDSEEFSKLVEADT
ncbi:MAG: hypothetical protein MRZ77_08005 [Clostridiales bacterium]|nr:hypothetical protein [Clostridiales bacterium]